MVADLGHSLCLIGARNKTTQRQLTLNRARDKTKEWHVIIAWFHFYLVIFRSIAHVNMIYRNILNIIFSLCPVHHTIYQTSKWRSLVM